MALAGAHEAQAQTPGKASAAPADSSGDVVVTAERPPSQALIDRKVYTVSRDLQATSGSAADVLSNVPSVAVDADGNVSVRGDPNVAILVDGKPSAQFSGAASGASLLQFPASEIDRVEVLTNPPAQYKAEGSGGVINIITKKNRKAGLSGTERLSVGDHGRYVLGLDGSYNSKRLRLSGGVGLRRDIRERMTTTDRLETDPSTGLPVQSHQGIDEHFRRLTPSVKAGLDYDFNDKQSAGASFSDRVLTGHRFFDQQDQSGAPSAPAASLSSRHSDGHEWHLETSEGAHFEQKLWRPGETFTLAVQRSATHERERYAYSNSYALPPADPTFDDLHLAMDLEKTELSADYDLPLAQGGEVKLGYDLELDRNAFDNRGDNIDPASGQPILDPAVTNDFRYRQAVNAAYGEYQAGLGPWSLQAGLRLEAARASWLLITGDVPGRRTDLGLYPSLHLERSLGEADKLTLGVSRRITRPDPEALNPFSDHQDTHNLRAGNPNLRPQDTWSYELGYNSTIKALTYGATVYYRMDRNGVTDILQPISADVVLSTKANLPRSRAAGLEFNANGKLGRRLSFNLSGDYFYSQIDASSLGFPGLRSTTGLNLKASLEYRPTRLDTAQVSVTRADKRLTPQGYVSAINLVNLGYRRQLRPDFSIVATVSDLLNGQKYRRLVTTAGLTDNYLRYQVGRIVYVGFVYTFGASPKKASGFDYDQ